MAGLMVGGGISLRDRLRMGMDMFANHAPAPAPAPAPPVTCNLPETKYICLFIIQGRLGEGQTGVW